MAAIQVFLGAAMAASMFLAIVFLLAKWNLESRSDVERDIEARVAKRIAHAVSESLELPTEERSRVEQAVEAQSSRSSTFTLQIRICRHLQVVFWLLGSMFGLALTLMSLLTA